MKDLIFGLVIVVLVVLLSKKNAGAAEPKEDDKQLNNDAEYIKGAYKQKWMFTQNEKPAYYKLKEIADKHGLLLFTKVRLWDLVEPVSGHPKYKTNRYRIQAKHVDFVLCKSNLVAKYVIELDDSSHDTQKGKSRDLFVDTVLTSCGYKVLHTRFINEEEIEKFISE